MSDNKSINASERRETHCFGLKAHDNSLGSACECVTCFVDGLYHARIAGRAGINPQGSLKTGYVDTGADEVYTGINDVIQKKHDEIILEALGIE